MRGEQFSIKQMERTRKQLEGRLRKLQAEERKDDVVTFEELGVDRLFVDEAHAYKNLFLTTKMRNVAGLSTSEAQKSTDMFLKCRYMDELTGGRGVIFATGTPISNSMTEMHINKGKTIAQCMKARIDYVKNPDKTEDGEFISSYACAPESADQEFVLARNQYLMNAGNGKKNEVIAYQLRQSFKPGEVSAEEANQIGYELAERLLHGEHAFIVATHTDRKHIHNHIVFCSTALDCSHKFRNVWNSSRLVAEISDELCREHHLSIVQVPQNKTVSYEKWEGDKSKLTSRDSLRITIDAALRMQPDGFDALMQLMEEAGCWIKRGAHVSIKPPGGERYIRLDSLGAEYSEAKLRKVLDGHHIHIPKIPRSEYNYSQVKRLIDVEAKLREGKGKGYMIWAERNNIDAKAQSIIFLKEHNIGSIEELENQIKLCCSDYLP